jgi:hypothetical protein
MSSWFHLQFYILQYPHAKLRIGDLNGNSKQNWLIGWSSRTEEVKMVRCGTLAPSTLRRGSPTPLTLGGCSLATWVPTVTAHCCAASKGGELRKSLTTLPCCAPVLLLPAVAVRSAAMFPADRYRPLGLRESQSCRWGRLLMRWCESYDPNCDARGLVCFIG